MAHFLIEQQHGTGWAAVSLDGDAEVYFLTGDPATPVVADEGDERSGSAVYVIRHSESNGEKWKLFAAPDAEVYLNGHRVSFCMQVLKDNDELRVGGSSRLRFSTKHLARI